MSKNSRGYIFFLTLCLLLVFSSFFMLTGISLTYDKTSYTKFIIEQKELMFEQERAYSDYYDLFGRGEIDYNYHVLVNDNTLKNTKSGNEFVFLDYITDGSKYYIIRRKLLNE